MFAQRDFLWWDHSWKCQSKQHRRRYRMTIFFIVYMKMFRLLTVVAVCSSSKEWKNLLSLCDTVICFPCFYLHKEVHSNLFHIFHNRVNPSTHKHNSLQNCRISKRPQLWVWLYSVAHNAAWAANPAVIDLRYLHFRSCFIVCSVCFSVCWILVVCLTKIILVFVLALYICWFYLC